MSIEITLTDEQAEAFAQFLKRVGLTDYRSLATSDEEAYCMLSAGEAIRTSLAEAGFSPRWSNIYRTTNAHYEPFLFHQQAVPVPRSALQLSSRTVRNSTARTIGIVQPNLMAHLAKTANLATIPPTFYTVASLQ